MSLVLFSIIVLLVGVIGWAGWLALQLMDLWQWGRELTHWKTVRQPCWERAKYLLGFS
jgi:hypothetical protein